MALTPVHELQALIHAKIAAVQKPLETETVPLVSAVGRVLAQDVAAAVNIPPADISAMDGYALPVAAAAGSEWKVVGESVAGQPFSGSLPADGCVRIMTGAVVPAACSSVVIQENVQLQDGVIRLEKDAAEGGNIRRRGEEIAAGDTVLQVGRILRQADIMLLAALGYAQIEVRRKLRVAVLSSGDELLEPGTADNRTDRIYDSNRYMLMARLAPLPVEVIDFGQVADRLEDVLKMLNKVIHQADVLITTGGVSVGDYDFMREAVERVGSIHHYKVALKPGKPFVFGQIMTTWCFGLPGNPVSVFTTFHMYVAGALAVMSGLVLPERGATVPSAVMARARVGWDSPEGKTQFIPLRFVDEAVADFPGQARSRWVEPVHAMGSKSHLVASLAHAQGIGVVAPEFAAVEEGQELAVVQLVG